ncbi:MAG: methyltransferase domain-containing protein, partial [Proteobacteria bacterium]|nr:methyltransferase domain-containing protein [Pseudomonadota bacterium]
FANTHPDRMHTIGTLYGMSPTVVERCRVLELGCGAGENLVPMSVFCPESTFVGYDLSGDAIAAALSRVEKLNLANLHFHQGDICAMPKDIGLFDYIICHGVYSWVPRRVRLAIFDIIKKHLAPQGLAFVSYNTLPGWHLRNVARTLFRYHGEQFDDPIEQVKQGRLLLNFIGNSLQEDDTPWSRVMGHAVRLMEQSEDEYLYHDFFAPVNEPILFKDFLRQARDAELEYVADAEFNSLKTLTLPGPLQEMLDRLSADIESSEQYLDLVSGTSFRRSLLCHRGVSLNRTLGWTALEELNVRMVGTCDEGSVDLNEPQPVEFTSKNDELVTVGSPLAQAALFVVMASRPRSLPFEEVFERACDLVDEVKDDESRQKLGGNLLTCYRAGLVDLHGRQVACASAVVDQPRAHDFVRSECWTDVEYVTNPHHEIIGMEPFAREMLRLADGTNTHGDLVEGLVEAVQEGRLKVQIDDQTCTDLELIRESVRAMLALKLDILTRAALFA